MASEVSSARVTQRHRQACQLSGARQGGGGGDGVKKQGEPEMKSRRRTPSVSSRQVGEKASVGRRKEGLGKGGKDGGRENQFIVSLLGESTENESRRRRAAAPSQ